MLQFQISSELCAIASVANTIPDELLLIQDKLASFLQRIHMTFADRPDELRVGMEVWCKDSWSTYKNGIIRYIGTVKPQNELNLIDVELSNVYIDVELFNIQTAGLHRVPHNEVLRRGVTVTFKPAYVFQIFQSTVRIYDVSKRYGFLNCRHNRSLFFHTSGVIWNEFPHSRIEAGQIVKHTIRYNLNQRWHMINIVADNIFPLSLY